MSRLIEILKENNPIGIDANLHKAYTDVGNLFRLMMAVNTEYPIPPKVKTNVVTTMLPTLIQDNKKVVTQIQKSFGLIKTDGLKAKSALKKTYFNAIFTLLLPFTGSNAFKVSTLSTLFSNGTGKDEAENKKKTAVIHIGKALIGNDKLALNPKDIQLIKSFTGDMETVQQLNPVQTEPTETNNTKPNEDENKVSEQPINPVDEVVTPEITDEKLLEIHANSEKVLKTINDMPDLKKAIEQNRTMLDNNKSAEMFKVPLSEENKAADKILNDQITAAYDKATKELGQKNANFACQVLSNIFDKINKIPGYYLSAYKDYIKTTITKTDKGFSVFAGVGIKDTHKEDNVFFASADYEINKKTGKMTVHRQTLQLPEKAKETGINKQLFKDDLALYKAADVDKITLEANVDVGGYAWFRYGFIPNNDAEMKKVAKWIIKVSEVANLALQYDAEKIAAHIKNNVRTITPGIKNLIDLLNTTNQKNLTSNQKIIKELFKNCSAEFEKTFVGQTKEGFKELSKNIALMNFAEYTISKKVYSISYKALLSIQSIKDPTSQNNDRIMPFNNAKGNIYISWNGTLDMNDLDETYAYLKLQK